MEVVEALKYISQSEYLPVTPEPPSSNESLLESVRELSRLAEVVIASGLCEG